ncbi:hypothetical protein [Enterococcus sp. DIV0086]|uniref:hypothetical protein n=1 Tax=Enterococcus sp. DIV0086 TaxID=2774655 RepID=UPI003D2BC232
MKKIYKRMKNGAEAIQENFEELVKTMTTQSKTYSATLTEKDIVSEQGKEYIRSAALQFDRQGDVTTLSGHIIVKKGFGSSAFVLFQVPYGFRTYRVSGNTQTIINVKKIGKTPISDYVTYSWDNERILFYLSETEDYYIQSSWSSKGMPTP